MFYPESKVYNDGSHFIAIPHSTNPAIRRERPPEELVEVVDADKEDSSEAQMDESSDAAGENDVSSADEKPQKEKDKKPKRVATRSEIFNGLYAESAEMPRAKRKAFLINGMRKYFKTRGQTELFVEKKLEQKRITI